MATATKSAKTKMKRGVVRASGALADAESGADIAPTLHKKPLEIDEPEVVAGVEEKAEEDPLAAATEEDGAEEMSLDGEELNPFGDRWEE